MSDDFVTFLRLTPDEGEATQAIDSAVAWLLDEEIIVARPDGWDRFYGRYRDGPCESKAFGRDGRREEIPDRLDFGVSVVKDWLFESNVDGYEWPPCPQCGVHLIEGTTKELVFGWMDTREEPEATCAACGHRDLLGNFEHVLAGYCSHASLSFVNSGPLDEGFEQELLQRIGGRSRVLYVHL